MASALERVTIVSWGNIENPDEPSKWGLKVGKSYVCRNKAPLLFYAKSDAIAEGERLKNIMKAGLWRDV